MAPYPGSLRPSPDSSLPSPDSLKTSPDSLLTPTRYRGKDGLITRIITVYIPNKLIKWGIEKYTNNSKKFLPLIISVHIL